MLTKKNYFTPTNKYLSSSKLKDFMIDPFYFYKKHITHEITMEQTPSMRIGSAVDCILTGYSAEFRRKYIRVERRNLKESPKQIELTPAEYDKIMAISAAVKATTVYKDIKKNYKAQQILTMEFLEKNDRFPGLAGIPDWYKISPDGQIATLIDLKTTSDVEYKKFQWVASDMGYYFQQAVYQILLEEKYPQIIEWESFILAVENDAIINRVRLYQLNQNEIEMEKMRVKDLIRYVCNYKFKPTDVTWDDCIEL